MNPFFPFFCIAWATLVTAPSVRAVDFIRQIQLVSGQTIVHDIPIGNATGEVRSKPIQGEGSIFQLYAYDDATYSPFTLLDVSAGTAAHANVSLDSHLVDVNALGLHLDVVVGQDTSPAAMPHLLAEKAVGAFIPEAVVTLKSEDPYFPPRTRADQPYGATIGISRLPLQGEPVTADMPSKVYLEKSYKLYHPTLHVPSSDGSGQGTYAGAFEFSMNGTYSMPDLYQLLPGSSPTHVMGEETHTASVKLGESGALARIGTATIQVWPVSTAEIQGIDPSTIYHAVPGNVRVALTDLYPDSVTYAQIYAGQPQLGTTGAIIPSSVFSINTYAPQNTVVPVVDVTDTIQDDGVYTIEVLTITPFNHRQPERVTYATINIKRTVTVNATMTTSE